MTEETKSIEVVTASISAQALTPNRPLQIGSFRVLRQVTRTVLQQREGQPFAVTIQTEIYQGEELAVGRGGAPKMQPARITEVLNIETGELQLLIMNTVLEGELIKAYPGNAYVGKSFLIRQKPGGVNSEGQKRRYKVYEIAEIELAGETASGEVVTRGENPVNRAGVELETVASAEEKPAHNKKK